MTPSELQEFVEQDKDLNDLLHNNTIYLYTKFSNSRYDNEALKAHIADDYYKSFSAIYEANINSKKISLIVPLIKSIDFLATSEVKNQIMTNYLIPSLMASTETLNKLKANIDGKDLEGHAEDLDAALSSPVFQTINQFGTEDNIKGYKTDIISTCLDICDEVANVNPSKEMMKYAVHNVIMNNLKKVKNFGEFQQKFDKHYSKISDTRDSVDNKYAIWVIIIAILFVIRMIARLT